MADDEKKPESTDVPEEAVTTNDVPLPKPQPSKSNRLYKDRQVTPGVPGRGYETR